mmetsp:Transcript_37278/g.120403  ORF Transcript_37278/g.120403 Transcript_37278/m.120403 type:complete len:274 (+) Transcript_37278:1982-2803(+)
MNHPREAAPRRVEARERLVWQSAGREPARLCRETDGAHAACAEAGRCPRDEVLRVELQVRHVEPEGGGVVAAVVLEADGDGGEEGEGVGVVARELLDDVEAVDEVVHHGAGVAWRALVLGAEALIDGVQQLEVWRRVAVRVVGVHADREGRVREVLLDRAARLLRVWHSAHVELRPPLGRAEGGEQVGHLCALAKLCRHATHERDAHAEQVGQHPAPRGIVGDEVVEQLHRRRGKVLVPQQHLGQPVLLHLQHPRLQLARASLLCDEAVHCVF